MGDTAILFLKVTLFIVSGEKSILMIRFIRVKDFEAKLI
jgi:hypothetical protein